MADVDSHNSVTIKTANGTGNLSLEYSNQGWPNSSNLDGSSDNAGNNECIHVTGGTNYWSYLKVSGSNGTASILVEFDGAGCQTSGGNNNTAPTANANGTYSGTENSAINFSSAGSSDVEGPIAAYSWSFGDGASSASANPSHTYSNAGSYSVSLTVTDAEGLSSTISKTVSVSQSTGCNGVAAWNANTSYSVGDTVSFNGRLYEAIWWSTGAQPDVFSNVWSNRGACN